MKTTTTLRTKLSDLRDKSALAWEGAVEGGQSDGGRGVAERAAMREGLASWDAALEAIEAGDLETAAEEMEEARRRAAEFGDDQFERSALTLLKSASIPDPTDDQLRALRAEAGEAGDVVQAWICAVALGDEDPLGDAETYECRFGGSGLSRKERASVLAIVSREDAVRECARVIADAAAQAEGGAL